jgi:hypothetical protein
MAGIWDYVSDVASNTYNYWFPPTTAGSNPYSLGLSDYYDIVSNAAGRAIDDPVGSTIGGFNTALKAFGEYLSSFMLWLVEMSIWATLEIFYLTITASLKVAFDILDRFGVFDALSNALNSLDSETVSVLHYLTVDKLAVYCLVAMLSRFILRIYWK